MYRLTSDPDIPSSYTIVTTALIVPVGGVLTPAFIIDHLENATSYTVKIKSDCGNYSLEAEFTTGTVCPHIIDILEDDLIAYWGWKNTKDVLSEVDIVSAPLYQYVSPTQDIECSFAGGFAAPMFLWMAEPVACLRKHKWEDIVEVYNHGDISTDQDLFSSPVISGGYRFYITEYLTQQDNTIKFKTS